MRRSKGLRNALQGMVSLVVFSAGNGVPGVFCAGNGVPGVFLPPEELVVVTAKVVNAVYLRLLFVQLSCSGCRILWSFSCFWLNSHSYPASGRAKGICCVNLCHRCCDNALLEVAGGSWGTCGLGRSCCRVPVSVCDFRSDGVDRLLCHFRAVWVIQQTAAKSGFLWSSPL